MWPGNGRARSASTACALAVLITLRVLQVAEAGSRDPLADFLSSHLNNNNGAEARNIAAQPATRQQKLEVSRDSKKTVLVTGGAGFIGFHLTNLLHDRGDEVVAYDNFNQYYDVRLKEARAQNLTSKGIKVVEGDVCDDVHLHHLFKTYQFTHVAHLAAQAGVRYSLTHPQEYVKNNIQCFVTLLEVLKDYSETVLVYASSSSVYGQESPIPFDDTQANGDHADRQVNLYGATKRADELIAHAYHNLYGIRCTGLRFFTVYGPWGRPDMSPYIFVSKISNDEPIDVYGNGDMYRDFTYVEDIVDGISRCIDLGDEDQVYNIGNGNPVPLMDFIGVVEKALGKTATKNMLPMNNAELKTTFASVKKLHDATGYEPKIKVEVGIPRFVEWYTWFYARSSEEVNEAAQVHEYLHRSSSYNTQD